jgi:hypothetical protein
MKEGQSGWDEAFAEDLVGAVVLVGLTRRTFFGLKQEQFHGVVLAASASDGITLRLEGKRKGETYQLPPDLRALHPASPGEYRLRSTGEVISNPDYVTSWTVDPPKQ